MTIKSPENKRQAKAARLTEKVTKPSGSKKKTVGLKDQYRIIKDDLVKLRDDLNTGIEMAKGMVDNMNRKEILKGFMSNLNK
jgi:hypothetical protein